MTSYKKFIREWYDKPLLSKWGKLQPMVDELIVNTSYLPSDATLKQRFWHEHTGTTGPELCTACGVNPVKFVRGSYRLYCSTKCSNGAVAVQAAKQASYIEKYGVSHPSKSKVVQDKKRHTAMARYGVDHYSKTDEYKEKIKQTSLDNFGVEHHLLSPVVKQKRVDTVQSRYGVDNVFQDEDVKAKIRVTLGVDHVKHLVMSEATLAALDDMDFLLEENKTKSLVQIAAEIECNPSTIEHRIKKAGHFVNKSHTTSYIEQQIKDFITELGIAFVENDRSVIGKEIDIYIPDLKIGIEVNGCYWHSAEKKDRHYHVQKTLDGLANRVQIIHVFDIDWYEKNEIVRARLRNILGKTARRVYACKCVATVIGKGEAKDFLARHHLQGPTVASVNLGLEHDGELVAVMTFGRPRYSRVAEYELLRFCSSCSVVGGASKLFKHFVSQYAPATIVSYADRSWSDGGLYRTLGFDDATVDAKNTSYFYTDGKQKYHRSSFTKAKLVSDGYDASLTEAEIMAGRGFTKVWTSGNYTFLWVS